VFLEQHAKDLARDLAGRRCLGRAGHSDER
jgi:hypothetical protein